MADELPEFQESDEEARRRAVVLLAVLVEGGLLAASSVLGWIVDQPPLRFFEWSVRAVLWGVAATLPLLGLFFLLMRWPIGPLKRIRHFSEEVIRPLFAPCSRFDLLGMSLLAGLGEEIMFRGVLQSAFTGWFGIVFGIAMTSILFGLLHSITFTYMLLATLMGAYLSCVWLAAERNLLAVIVTHGLYDFVVLLWLLHGPGSTETLPLLEKRRTEEQSEKTTPSEPES
jgi:membrane protease YdiL (CAAX protease family)